MAGIIHIDAFHNKNGSLVALQDQIPFSIMRVYYMYDVPRDAVRGGHRHKVTRQALVCVNGCCEVYIDNGLDKYVHTMDHPQKVLILEPEDWHLLRKFTQGSVVMVLASHKYDPEDYVMESYG